MTYQEKIKFLSDDYGYSMILEKPENKLMRFQRGDWWIDVWHSTMTVGIYFRARNKKYIRNVSLDELKYIFTDPKELCENTNKK